MRDNSIFRQIAMRYFGRLVYLKRLLSAGKLKHKDLETVFSEYYKDGEWVRGEGKSRSGPGSDIEYTESIRRALPELCRELGIKTLLDIPCGDLTWMSQVDLPVDRYIGADIVQSMVDANTVAHGNKQRQFEKINIVSDKLPQADLVMVRDLFIHLNKDQISRSLANIGASGSRWLLTTTYPKLTVNSEIVPGQFRPINLTISPFNLPQPARIIHDDPSVKGDEEGGRSMGLWAVSDLPKT
jgi:hypothetical protein